MKILGCLNIVIMYIIEYNQISTKYHFGSKNYWKFYHTVKQTILWWRLSLQVQTHAHNFLKMKGLFLI